MDEKESIEALKKRVNRKTKIALAIFVVASLGLGTYIATSGGSVTNSIFQTEQSKKDGGPAYMEDHSGNAPSAPAKEEGQEPVKPSPNTTATMVEHPDTLTLSGRDFLLFDGDVLLPLDTEAWSQYHVPGSENDLYDGIDEFYVKGETPQDWTQKFTVHHVKNPVDDCSVLAEKIVNGLIANIMESMDTGDLSFSPDNISVNYVKKDKDNALFYWGKKNIENVPDETQFVRLFSATYSKKMYFVTYTLKMNINDMSVEDITKYMKTLNSIQELKKNEAGGQQQ